MDFKQRLTYLFLGYKMSDLVSIEAQARTGRGKGYARKLRASGKIPANVLEGGKATAIEFDPKLLSKAWKSTKQFSLVLNGAARTVSIKELQIDPVRRIALHVDLMYV